MLHDRRACRFTVTSDDVDDPGGSPASSKDDASSRTVRGVCSAGLSTTEQPAQIAGASFQVAISSGIIPWNDLTSDSNRFAECEGHCVVGH